MGTIASQITSLTIVYSTIYSGPDKKKSKLRLTGLCEGNSPMNGESPHKGSVTRKMFHLMTLSCENNVKMFSKMHHNPYILGWLSKFVYKSFNKWVENLSIKTV